MNKVTTYEVIQEFKEDNDNKILKRHKKCLQSFQKGDQFTTAEYIKKYQPNVSCSLATLENTVYASVKIAKELNLIRIAPSESTTFDEFCQFETVQYCSSQLKGCTFRNKKATQQHKEYGSTRGSYLYKLWSFNNWLATQKFSYSRLVQTGIDSYKKIDETIQLKGLEQFFNLYKESHQSPEHFIKTIKRYLLDKQVHEGKKEGTIKIVNCAIKAYFETNDRPIQYKFNAKTSYSVKDDEEEPIVTLEDLLKILTIGKPSITEYAVVLCKFHRGLDNSTLSDRFNYQAWEQLCEYFGTNEFESWDLKKCPVPIKLTRVKTNYTHVGFIDVDAVKALQVYLKYREEKMLKPLKNGEPMFITLRQNPITDAWINRRFTKLTRIAGLQRKLKGYIVSTRYEKGSHEMRDLLKSTMIVCGCRYDVADHVIGHKPKDSYEKQATLYPESMRAEFMKVSKKINIFSNIAHYMKGTEDVEALQQQVTELRGNQEKIILELARLEEIKKIKEKIEAKY